MFNWAVFSKRTDDPKLAYLEARLTDMGIPHRRNGFSFHAPIVEVPQERFEEAYAIWNQPFDEEYDRTDDVPDHEEIFEEYTPHDWIPS